jgi:hypothetical protein
LRGGSAHLASPKYLADDAVAAGVELSAADLAELDALPAPEGARY